MKQVLTYTCYLFMAFSFTLNVDVTDLTFQAQNGSETKTESLVFYIAIILLLFLCAFFVFIYLKKTKANKTLIDKNKTLETKISQLEEVNEVKDKLFSIVSHDLKDSILSIKSLLDLFNDNEISQKEFNELIPELSDNANNASTLLFNLLNWSKSQMQNLQPKPIQFDIKNTFDTKISLIEKKSHDKGITISNKLHSNFVLADQSMIEIIIQNLITNAIKFSGKGDTITISNKHLNNNVIISVKDTGIGISQKNIEKLFDSEENFSTIGTQNEKGNGLGLSICKELVELNNGSIWADSTPNVGSEFFIQLPTKNYL